MICLKHKKNFDRELHLNLCKFVFNELQSNMKTNIDDFSTLDLWTQLRIELRNDLNDQLYNKINII